MKNVTYVIASFLLFFTLLLVGCNDNKEMKDKFETSQDIYKSYGNKNSSTLFSIPPGIASLFLDNEIDGNEELKEILRDVKQLTFLVVPNDTKAKENSHYIDIKTRLENINYRDLALVKSPNEIVNVKISPDKTSETTSEMVVLVSNSESLFCVSFRGNIDISKIKSLARPENMSAISNLNRLKR